MLDNFHLNENFSIVQIYTNKAYCGKFEKSFIRNWSCLIKIVNVIFCRILKWTWFSNWYNVIYPFSKWPFTVHKQHSKHKILLLHKKKIQNIIQLQLNISVRHSLSNKTSGAFNFCCINELLHEQLYIIEL